MARTQHDDAELRAGLVAAVNGNPIHADLAWTILKRWDEWEEVAWRARDAASVSPPTGEGEA